MKSAFLSALSVTSQAVSAFFAMMYSFTCSSGEPVHAVNAHTNTPDTASAETPSVVGNAGSTRASSALRLRGLHGHLRHCHRHLLRHRHRRHLRHHYFPFGFGFGCFGSPFRVNCGNVPVVCRAITSPLCLRPIGATPNREPLLITRD